MSGYPDLRLPGRSAYLRNPGFYSQNTGSDDERTRVPSSIYPSRQEDVYSPWRLFEERVRTGPYGLSRFPSQPYSPVRILVYDFTNERVNPRLRQFIQDSPPHIQGEWHLPSTQESGLTNEEFKKAMKKVKKQVYNPPYPRKKAWKRGLFNKTSSNNINNGGDEEKDEGKTTCVICLESFEPSEQVLVTPCNHMFHHDCLVPWLKSQGKCPVCRFSLYEGKKDNQALALSNDNNSSVANDDLIDLAVDLIALVRAMEEAFNWVNLRRSV